MELKLRAAVFVDECLVDTQDFISHHETSMGCLVRNSLNSDYYANKF